MNEDFLENDIDGDVGGYLARSKRQRRQVYARLQLRAVLTMGVLNGWKWRDRGWMEMQGLSRIEARAIVVCLVIVSGEEFVIFDGPL